MCDTVSAYYNQLFNGSENVDSGFSAKYEYCMVFKLEDNNDSDPKTGAKVLTQPKIAKQLITMMLQQGLELFIYKSVQQDEMYVLISASLELLKMYADKTNFKLPLDEEQCKKLMEAGNNDKRIEPVQIKDDRSITPLSPYEQLYGKYESEVEDGGHCYKIDPETKSPFSREVRRKLIYYILQGPVRDGGCDIEISKLIHLKKMLAFFPLHSSNELTSLTNKCRGAGTMPWNQPLDEIKVYFGEKYALYNAFLGHYTKLLIIPAIIGLVFQIVVWKHNDQSHPVMPFFAVVICLWAVSMLETWKGTQAQHALKWGMLDFESDEPDRPEFLGLPTFSHIDGKFVHYFPNGEYFKRFTISFFSIVLFIVVVVSVVASIYLLRYSMQKAGDNETGASTLASVLNTVQITVFNMIYQTSVTKLTDLENHRTDTQYEDSLIAKLFAFQFVNSYASFFFLAFVAPYLENVSTTHPEFLGQCGATDCMQPLAINLAIVFGTRLALTNFLELLFPLMAYVNKKKAETNDIPEGTALTPAENEYIKVEYNAMQNSIKDYADTTIQFGYMCLFIAALPIACLFSIVSSYAKLRIMATNMFRFFQRPVPVGAEDIGTWQGIFVLMAVISVITNAGIIVFTMNIPKLRDYTSTSKMWIFIGFQWGLIAFQYFLMSSIPDLPDYVNIQKARNSFIASKLIEYLPDENFIEPMFRELEASGEADSHNPSTASQLFRDMGAMMNDPKYVRFICCCLKQPRDEPLGVKDVTDEEYPFANYPTDASSDTSTTQSLSSKDAKISKSAKIKEEKRKRLSMSVSSGSINVGGV